MTTPRTSPALVRSLLTALLTLALGTGCVADDVSDDMLAAQTDTGTDTDADPGSTSVDTASTGMLVDGSSGSESGGIDPAELYDCEEPDLTVVMPLSGPGYDPAQGLAEPIQDQYVVHTTQLLVKPDDAAQGEFFALVAEVQEQLASTDGFVALSLAFEPNCGFARTMGIWRSEENMYQFVGSGAHLEAMGRTTAISITGRTTHWTADLDAMPPTWDQALEQIADVEPLGY